MKTLASALLGLCACAPPAQPALPSSPPAGSSFSSQDAPSSSPLVRPKGGPRFERAFEEAYNGHWPCRGAGGLVFCVRNSVSFGIDEDEGHVVHVRIDLARNERRVVGLSTSLEGQYVSDGTDVYAVGESGLDRMPRSLGPIELAQPLPGLREAKDVDVAVAGKDVWLRSRRGDSWRFAGWHIGEPQPFAELTHPRHADDDTTFIAGHGRIEFLDGEGSRVAFDVASRKSGVTRLPTDVTPISGPGKLAMNAKESFWVAWSDDGAPSTKWQILAVSAADDAARVVYEETTPEKSPSTPGPFAIIADDAHVYFLRWKIPRGESGIELMRLPVEGGKPEHLGRMFEHGYASMWFDGDALYVSGSASGTIYRWWRR